MIFIWNRHVHGGGCQLGGGAGVDGGAIHDAGGRQSAGADDRHGFHVGRLAAVARARHSFDVATRGCQQQ